jgi:hypothetical protein
MSFSSSVLSGRPSVPDLSVQPQPEWPRVSVRPAGREEIPELTKLLREQADYFEQNDISRSILFVAEYDEEIVGFCAARLQFQIEPLLLTRKFKQHGPHFAQAKATYLLIREMDRWIANPEKNRTGISYYFCHIRDKTMQKLALSFGMTRVYFGKFFGRESR